MMTKERRTRRTQMGVLVLWAGVAAAYPTATAHAVEVSFTFGGKVTDVQDPSAFTGTTWAGVVDGDDWEITYTFESTISDAGPGGVGLAEYPAITAYTLTIGNAGPESDSGPPGLGIIAIFNGVDHQLNDFDQYEVYLSLQGGFQWDMQLDDSTGTAWNFPLLANREALRVCGEIPVPLASFFDSARDFTLRSFDRGEIFGSVDYHNCCSNCTEPCSSPPFHEVFRAGIDDNFVLPTELAIPGILLDPLLICTNPMDKNFDDLTIDTCFGHTITGLGLPGIIVGASLEIHLRAGPSSQACNDNISLQVKGSGPNFEWSRRIGTTFGTCIPTTAVEGLLTTKWVPGSDHTFLLDLCDLPNADGSSTDIIPFLKLTDRLDVRVQDDTGVDYMTLTVCYCTCTGPDDCNKNGIPDFCEKTTTRTFCVRCPAPPSTDCSNGTKWPCRLSFLPTPPGPDFVNLNCDEVVPIAGSGAVAMRAGLVACIDAKVCPGITTTLVSPSNDLKACFAITVPGNAGFEVCVDKGAGAPPGCCVTSGVVCNFNPELVEVLLSEKDCNNNNVDDALDIFLGTSQDVDDNRVPDECQPAMPTVSAWGMVVLILTLLIAIKLCFTWRRHVRA